jgi:hypothetical protein
VSFPFKRVEAIPRSAVWRDAAILDFGHGLPTNGDYVA